MSNGKCWNRRGGAAKGCLIAAGIVLLLLIGGGVLVAVKWKSWMSTMMKAGTEQMVLASPMPQDQKDRVMARVNTLVDDFKSGKVSAAQLGGCMKELAEGPIMPMAMVWAAQEKYVKTSALPAEEKSGAERTLQRVARGIVEKKIDQHEVDSMMMPISNNPPGGRPQLKPNVTIDELRAFLDKAKAKAEAAKIPDESYSPNVADEVDKAFEKGMKSAG